VSVIAADVLWSDPVCEPGLRNNDARGVGLTFGPDVTHAFLEANGVSLIVRSHEGPDARDKRTDLPHILDGHATDHVTPAGRLVTVFSAPDYPQFQDGPSRYNNRGAVVLLAGPQYCDPRFLSYEADPDRPTGIAFYDYLSYADTDEEIEGDGSDAASSVSTFGGGDGGSDGDDDEVVQGQGAAPPVVPPATWAPVADEGEAAPLVMPHATWASATVADEGEAALHDAAAVGGCASGFVPGAPPDMLPAPLEANLVPKSAAAGAPSAVAGPAGAAGFDMGTDAQGADAAAEAVSQGAGERATATGASTARATSCAPAAPPAVAGWEAGADTHLLYAHGAAELGGCVSNGAFPSATPASQLGTHAGPAIVLTADQLQQHPDETEASRSAAWTPAAAATSAPAPEPAGSESPWLPPPPACVGGPAPSTSAVEGPGVDCDSDERRGKRQRLAAEL